MSTMPVCRIPTVASKSPLQQHIAYATQISSLDIGKPILVNDEKEGILRYVGKTHFANGVWCGVELPQPIGKHDGCVQGRRYFECPSNCGLMVAASKCQIIQIEDNASGPYSILILNTANEKAEPIICNEEFNDETLINGNKKRKIELRFSQEFAPTTNNFIASTPLGVSRRKQQARSDTTTGMELEINKRDSLECDESLGILTPEQMVGSYLTSRTPSIELLHKVDETTNNKTSPVVTEFSLGIIDEQLINQITLYSTTTGKMELPLDQTEEFLRMVRSDQTPSPEELPLDPTPVLTTTTAATSIPNETKTINDTKNKTIVTSITSITSLDTGYQGDGENSRPASRGDNSSLARRPLPPRQRPPRAADPSMTDSDFYTESDHEENPMRRRAQVIDGVMYGIDAQATADLYANNRENMDSSGVFTDLERNEQSPGSETSTKTISGASQQEGNETMVHVEQTEEMQCTKKRNASDSIAALPSSSGHTKVKKREIETKVKKVEQQKKIALKKPNRWDAVMSKISKGGNEKQMNLKQVKSKVFEGVSSQQRNVNCKKLPNNKLKRATPKQNKNVLGVVAKSYCSSTSDLSAAGGCTSPKSNTSSAKKKQSQKITNVGSIVTSPKLLPTTTRTNRPPTESKKTLIATTKKKPTKENTGGVARKECSGRAPVSEQRPPTSRPLITKAIPNATEAMAVLVQHLVFNVEAYKVPILKKTIRQQEELLNNLSFRIQELESANSKQQDDCKHFRDEVFNMEKQLEDKQYEIDRLMSVSNEQERNCLCLTKQHEERILSVKQELEKLQQNHIETLGILREENDSIRDTIDEKNEELQQLQERYYKQITNFKTKELKLAEELDKLKLNHQSELSRLEDQLNQSRLENERILNFSSNYKTNATSIQEVQSLHVVLELKQTEVSELRRTLAEVQQKYEILNGAEERAAALNARCEDLEHQLQRKFELEQALSGENKKLLDSFREESNQKKRLVQYTEELQWKLQQNKEVVTRVLEQAVEEKRQISSTPNPKSTISPPTSPIVKGVVEKSDWVSYELDMNEAPEIMASRIVRRSFRLNKTPTPTKSPANKRARVKNHHPLQLSASESAIEKGRQMDFDEICWCNEDAVVDAKPVEKAYNLVDELDVDDLKLPALPSGGEALPSPKHLASESMTSETNSEDESTTSSSSVQI